MTTWAIGAAVTICGAAASFSTIVGGPSWLAAAGIVLCVGGVAVQLAAMVRNG